MFAALWTKRLISQQRFEAGCCDVNAVMSRVTPTTVTLLSYVTMLGDDAESSSVAERLVLVVCARSTFVCCIKAFR